MADNLNRLLQQRLAEIAGRYGVGTDAARLLLDALRRSGGGMAQFNHSDLGGSGQWMRGGMTMVGDMFNNTLKSKVDGLCTELTALLATLSTATEPATAAGSFQTQSQGGGSATGPEHPWQDSRPDFGAPGLVGGQNDMHYAYYPAVRRLVMSEGGRVRIYDTGDHQLQGASQQQQNGSATLSFSTPSGPVFLSSFHLMEETMTPPSGTQTSGVPTSGTAKSGTPKSGAASPAAAESSEPAAETVPETSELDGTSWMFAPADGAAPTLVTLMKDGVLAGAPSDRYRYWAKESGGLRFFAEDGIPSARFDTAEQDSSGATVCLRSTTEPRPILRRPAAEASAAEDTLSLSIPLTTEPWILTDGRGAVLCRLKLLHGGQMEGGQADSARWRVSDGILSFLHTSGRPTIRFPCLRWQDDQWELSGSVIGDDANARIMKRAR